MTPAILNQLGHLCPLLVELRLGNDAKTDAAMTRALPRLLPAVWQPVQELSWDQVDETAPHLQVCLVKPQKLHSHARGCELAGSSQMLDAA